MQYRGVTINYEQYHGRNNGDDPSSVKIRAIDYDPSDPDCTDLLMEEPAIPVFSHDQALSELTTRLVESQSFQEWIVEELFGPLPAGNVTIEELYE